MNFLLFMFHVCHAGLYVHCSLLVTCLERAYLLALLYVVFSCVLALSPLLSWVLTFAFFLTLLEAVYGKLM